MCGFAGKYFLNKSSFHEEDLEAMLQSIIHRGPDSEGRFSDGRALLGFRRLSIIDTVAGDQPLYNEDRQVVVIANGEIYNYQELKRLLKSKGHQFRSKSDCEVIVHLYEEFGSAFVEKLNGMFAFCLYDRRSERLLLCRDRIGIKPLYIYKNKDLLIFASEIKAILKATEVEPVENDDILEEYLCFRALSGSRTFFLGIELVTAGTVLDITPFSTKTITYWRPEYAESFATVRANVSSTIHKTLSRCVSRQLMADVPLGTQLSGGVDSSWVSCLAALESHGMKSFSVGFTESGFDETSDARIVAEKAKLEYHQIISNPSTFAESLPKVIWHNDEPLTHANSVEILNLCRYAKQHVKVLLTGEGADELFGGYPRYYLVKIAESFERIPVLLQPAFRYGVNWLTRGRGKQPGYFLGMSPRDLVFWNAAFVLPDKVAWLMNRDELSLAHRRKKLNSIWRDDLNSLDNLLLYELQSYLQPILLRQDKMSMGASIEARVPVLDNEMIELALSLNSAQKMKWFSPKYYFKKAALTNLPSKIVNKRKIGFSVPVGDWMKDNGPLACFLSQLYEQRHVLPGVNSRRLELLINEHQKGLVDHQDILWPLLNYVIWHDVFMNNRAVSS